MRDDLRLRSGAFGGGVGPRQTGDDANTERGPLRGGLYAKVELQTLPLTPNWRRVLARLRIA
jgi:hypothetical protein